MDLKSNVIRIQSSFMPDPLLSDIDFKNRLGLDFP